VLELLAVYSCPFVVCGDYNIHVDQSGDPHAIRLAELLLSFSVSTNRLTQLATFSTSSSPQRLQESKTCVSLTTHWFVSPYSSTNQLQPPSTALAELGDACHTTLLPLICGRQSCDLETCENMSVDDLVQLYNRVLKKLLDKHCPCVRVRRRNRQATPWFDADCRSARCHTRATEKRYRCTQADEDRRTWCKELRSLRQL